MGILQNCGWQSALEMEENKGNRNAAGQGKCSWLRVGLGAEGGGVAA
jgi:hypothetical protein